MQLKDKTGIACDRCGTTYKMDFEYYSFDFRLLTVTNNQRVALDDIFRSLITFSLDICTACFDMLSQQVVKNYAITMSPDVRKRGRRVPPLICELCGKLLSGTYNYYHCDVTKVKVQMTGQPNICVDCRQPTADEDKPCVKCGGVNFVRLALTKTDDRFVEINICEETFKEMVAKAGTIRRIAGEWATKTK